MSPIPEVLALGNGGSRIVIYWLFVYPWPVTHATPHNPHKHPKMLRCHVCAVKSTSFFFPQPSTCTRRNPKHSAQTEKCVTARNSCYRYYSYVLLYHWWIVALTARFFSLLVFATLSSLWLLQPSLLFGGKMNLNPKFHPFHRCFSWSLACSRKTPSVELCINILPMIFFQIRTSSRF